MRCLCFSLPLKGGGLGWVLVAKPISVRETPTRRHAELGCCRVWPFINYQSRKHPTLAPTSRFQGEVKKGDAHWSLLHDQCCPLPAEVGCFQLRPPLKSNRNRVYPISVGEGTDSGAKFIDAVWIVGRTLEHVGCRTDDSVCIAAILAPTSAARVFRRIEKCARRVRRHVRDCRARPRPLTHRPYRGFLG
jgi:hypothetical protein